MEQKAATSRMTGARIATTIHPTALRPLSSDRTAAATEDTSAYLSRALADTLRGMLADNGNRLRSLLFKLCVEINMMGHTVAAHFRADPINRRELRAYAVDEVLRTNGQISFDDALDLQRQIDSDE